MHISRFDKIVLKNTIMIRQSEKQEFRQFIMCYYGTPNGALVTLSSTLSSPATMHLNLLPSMRCMLSSTRKCNI
jgi:hypothetical protein